MNFEDFIKKEIKSLDETAPPETNWHPEKSWKRIEFALRGSGSGQAYFHYYLAASISFILIFSGIVGIYRNPQAAQEIQATLMNQIESITQEGSLSQTMKFVRKTPAALWEIQKSHPIEVAQISDQPRPSPSYMSRKKNPIFHIEDAALPQVTYVPAKIENPRFSLSMQVGAGLVGGTTAPNATFKAVFIMPGTGNIYHTVGASLSGYGFIEKVESGNSKMNPAVFLNVEFGRLRGPLHKWANRSWEIGIGYLVVNKSIILRDGGFRVFTRLPLTRYLKISPELIFTDKFKSVLPGVTISLG